MKKKKKGSCSLEQTIDRISYLPEPIRSRIISFLPMEEAIRTSILSKRWKSVCSSLSNLVFSQPCFERKAHTTIDFKDFVYQTLILHDGSDVEKFSLSVNVDDLSFHHIMAWISFAVRHNVRVLDLFVCSGELVKFPSCLFTCPTLTELRLAEINLELPTIIEFPMLKLLCLITVTFHDDIPPNQLISSCPVLEDLSMMGCSWNYQIVLTIDAPRLKALALLGDYPTHAIKISSANLHRIIYLGDLPNISLETLSSLYYVNFLFSESPSSMDIVLDELGRRASKILMGLRNVNQLMLRNFYIEYLTRVEDLSALCLTSCVSLKHLKLDIYPTENQVRVTTFLLKSYPNLQTLLISIQEISASTNMLNMEECWQSQQLSNGIVKHLKTVTINYFQGSEVELKLVRFLLEKAPIMEKMDITYSWKMQEDVVSVNRKIMAFTKVSPLAVISIS